MSKLSDTQRADLSTLAMVADGPFVAVTSATLRDLVDDSARLASLERHRVVRPYPNRVAGWRCTCGRANDMSEVEALLHLTEVYGG